MRQAVVDASVALKWYLEDEEYDLKALDLLKRTAIDGFMNLEIKLRSLYGLYSKVLSFCNIYQCFAYRAAYLAVADNGGYIYSYG